MARGTFMNIQPNIWNNLRLYSDVISSNFVRSAAEKLNRCVPILAYLHLAIAVLVITSGRVLAAVLVAGVLARIVYRIATAPTGNLGLVRSAIQVFGIGSARPVAFVT